MTKRCVDLILTFVGLVLTLPFLPLLALLIKWDSKGPVFYCCDRIGKDGTLFKMYKLRTMYETPVPIGDSISPQGDPRVTPFGRILRRTKLNELPQLLNILKGEMSFVGPRPEAPDLAALYPPHAREIFSVKPGLVGPNQILGRNEEEWYPQGVDPRRYYIEVILPKKLPNDLAYVREVSTFKDVQYIALGLRETIFKAIRLQDVLKNKTQLAFLGADCALSMLSFGLALGLQFESFMGHQALGSFLQLLPIIGLIRLPCFVYFGLYSTLTRYFSFTDILAVFQCVSTGSILFVLVGLTSFHGFQTLSPLALLIDWLGLLMLMLSLRIALFFFRERRARQPHQADQRQRVLIFGAGDAGALAYQFLMASKPVMHDVVGFLDDDAEKRHKTLYGKRVLGNRFNIGTLVQLHHVQEVLIALPSAPAQEIAAIKQACRNAGVKYRLFPTQSRSLRLAELFDTRELPLDFEALRYVLADKRVLITGVSGVFGLELCRQMLSFKPQRLIILERYEPYLTDLMSQLQQTFSEKRITPILCSSLDNGHIGDVLRDHRPDIIFHNAMRKYPPFFHFQMESIIRANYLLTFALAQQAALIGCSHFVLVSSEEAGKGGNLIADSLRVVEISLRQFFSANKTRLVVARMCDILESRDGVIARLAEQIRNQETIILPDGETQCSVLTKHSAVHFLLGTLVQTDRLAPEEGIFVCPFATSLRLLDVVHKLALLNGLQIGVDLHVQFSPSPSDAIDAEWASSSAELQADFMATGNPGIQLLKQSYRVSQEAVQAVHELLHFDEQDLVNDRWERPTRLLLCLESTL